MTKYGRSPWIDGFPASRVPAYPSHHGHLDTDVVIVGGGLTGCTTAYAFAAAGIKVALVEAERLGHGSTGSTPGWISDDPGARFVDVEKALGRRAAWQAWRAWHRAALDFAALFRRLRLNCRVEPRESLLVATTPEEAARLKRDRTVRREAGLEAPIVNSRIIATEAGMRAEVGIKTRGATLDPYRAVLGLTRAAADRGARLFERSPARRIEFGRRWVDVTTAGGTLRADGVVVATGMPTPLFSSLARHFWFRSSFFALTDRVPPRIRQLLGRGQVVIRDSVTPPHLIRWVDDERLLVGGADGEMPPARQRDRMIVQRTGQLMYELSTIYPDISGIVPAYGWEVPYARTAEALPFLGPHRNFPRHLFAFVDARQSVTGAYLASRILLRHYLNEADAADEVFGFVNRI